MRIRQLALASNDLDKVTHALAEVFGLIGWIVAGLVISFVFGTLLGIVVAWRRGSFLDNGAKRLFTGALLQSQDEGFGFFQETNGVTGSVLLQTGP